MLCTWHSIQILVVSPFGFRLSVAAVRFRARLICIYRIPLGSRAQRFSYVEGS